MATVGNLFLLLKKQRLIIIEVDLQNAQLYNNHMITSNFEIEVGEKKGSTRVAGIMKIKKLLKIFEGVLLLNQMPYVLFASEEKTCYQLKHNSNTGV